MFRKLTYQQKLCTSLKTLLVPKPVNVISYTELKNKKVHIVLIYFSRGPFLEISATMHLHTKVRWSNLTGEITIMCSADKYLYF